MEGEIEYLKQQLAQKQRRVDELQDKLAARPIPAPMKMREVSTFEPKPRGWDAYRANRRANDSGEEELQSTAATADAISRAVS